MDDKGDCELEWKILAINRKIAQEEEGREFAKSRDK